MSPRLRSLVLDKDQRPRRATITTRLGTVKVQGMDLLGNRCWFTSGIPDAKRLAVSAIERIERLVRDL